MIIDVFKKDYIQQGLFIFISFLALWVPAFLSPERLAIAKEPYSLFYNYMENFALAFPLVAVILSFVLIMAEGIYFNHILVSNNLIHSTTLFPMFAYIMLMSMNPTNQTFTPMLFSNIFLLIALQNTINCYNQEHSYEKVFNASFCIALAFLFYFPSVYMLLFVVGAFIVYKLYYWREWLVLLLGFIAPFFALFAYYYITDQLEAVIKGLSSEVMRFSICYDFSATVPLICGSVIVLLGVISLFAIMSGLSKKVIIYRKKTAIILLLLLLGVIFSMYDMFFPVNQQNFVIPMAFMLPTFFVAIRSNGKLCNTLFVLFLVALYVNVYLGF